jgi:hypothetical protein
VPLPPIYSAANISHSKSFLTIQYLGHRECASSRVEGKGEALATRKIQQVWKFRVDNVLIRSLCQSQEWQLCALSISLKLIPTNHIFFNRKRNIYLIIR